MTLQLLRGHDTAEAGNDGDDDVDDQSHDDKNECDGLVMWPTSFHWKMLNCDYCRRQMHS